MVKNNERNKIDILNIQELVVFYMKYCLACEIRIFGTISINLGLKNIKVFEAFLFYKHYFEKMLSSFLSIWKYETIKWCFYKF